MKHIISFLVVSVLVLGFVPYSTGQENDEQLPEFFGVYAKMSNGQLLELRSVDTYSFQSYEKRSTSQPRPVTLGDYERLFQDNDLMRSLDGISSPPKWYINGLPQHELKLSELEGFYVFGNYLVDDFSLTMFQPPNLTPNTVVIGGGDAGHGVRAKDSFIDTGRGWSLESSFRYVERADKLYWVALRAPLNTAESGEISFLAITFGQGRYWPFSIGKQRHQELLDTATEHYLNGEFERTKEFVQESLALRVSGQGYALLAKSVVGDWPDLGEEIVAEKISEADNLINRGLEKFPADEDLIFLKADIEARGEEYARSIKILTQLLLVWEANGLLPDKVKTDSGEYPLWSLYAWNIARMDQKSSRSVSRAELDGAVKMALVAIDVSETERQKANGYLALAECYFAKGDWAQAEAACNEGLRFEPSSRGAVLLKERISVEREGSGRSARRRRG
ncbi:MAG: hypothetical protein CMI53_04155 [Parcubacteria group bacterium]|jgi:tetratricopeptide (TPR) repeat protein|nr:hypothetical protein [Parcubacteria group bacterium]|tara:strand:+ start:344 stop:1693 length:1350 start_codon:yes stop_codon:yes gene_type:complete